MYKLKLGILLILLFCLFNQPVNAQSDCPLYSPQDIKFSFSALNAYGTVEGPKSTDKSNSRFLKNFTHEHFKETVKECPQFAQAFIRNGVPDYKAVAQEFASLPIKGNLYHWTPQLIRQLERGAQAYTRRIFNSLDLKIQSR